MGVYQDLMSVRTQNDSLKGIVKRASWAVSVQGVDITNEINRDLLSMTVTDNEEDEADDLQITLADKDVKWIKYWLNDSIQAAAKTKELEFRVWIGTLDSDGKILQQKCGTFTLDSIQHSGPPSKLVIKCISLDFGGGIRDEKRSKAWEGYTLQGIARDIANVGKLELMYCSDKSFYYPYQEQSEETDIGFLKRMCQNAGMALKCIDNKLVLFDKDTYGAGDPIRTISYGGNYTKWNLSTTSGDVTYDMCSVRYMDPATKKLIEGTVFTDDYDKRNPEHTELIITDVRVTSVAEALQIAEQQLKLHNQYEKTAQFTFQGDPTLMAGLTVFLSGFGYFDGKYMIKKCEHSISASGYTTKITLRTIPAVNETQNYVSLAYSSKNGG